MKKIATLATAAAMLAGVGTYAFAQAQPPVAPPPASQDQAQQQRPQRPRMTQDDFNRLVDARVAGIKAGLKLSADQEKLWGPVETAMRNAATQRYTRMTQFRENREQRRSADFMQRLEQRSTMQNERAQTSAAITTALRPLWDTFSEDQKRIAPRLVRQALNDGPGWRERGGRDGHHGRRAEMRQHGMMGQGGMGQGGMMGPGPRGPAPQQ
ncbi:Spy/CpxP family protein refolding chaperone [Microvirga sp. ACRRW]|uniref:Spy/CpxP family protein refolding chaperone n=1 Tax=Microvirga sp. ACRRW TaxID=2918205 RepID=UPI001EF734BA|nr:Spy/CpxP family protein refolding chaperone [Microvirga sp. ACRRW]MCG7391423.1 Spy/CpxP family protein refolding chaperone [Microvirga sp. ACRRW]